LKKDVAIIGLKGLPAFGGAATVGEKTIEQLKDKYNFTVYSIDTHTNKSTGQYNGYEQIVLSSIKNKKLNTLWYYIKSAVHVMFSKYDLVHLHHGDAAFILLLLRLKYKTIVTTHGAHNAGKSSKWKKYRLFFELQSKYLLKLSNIVTCVAKVEQKWLKDNCTVDAIYIPNGISLLNNTSNKVIEKKYELFYGAGRIMRSKGCDLLLKALNNINFTQNIAIAGDLTQSLEYKTEIEMLAENLDVNFLGMIKDKNKLFNMIRSSKIFVYPTLYEAMSMMLLEVASLRIPMICSDIQENKDVFSDDEVLFFSLTKSGDFEEKILWALSNYETMLVKADNAYKKLNKEFLWKNIALEYETQYKYLL
jgi:glycosyltransferase involved in cell wall biosynthesis